MNNQDFVKEDYKLITYILTDNIRKFEAYIQGKDRTKFVWLNDPKKLSGVLNPRIVRIGEYWRLKNLDEIEAHIIARNGIELWTTCQK